MANRTTLEEERPAKAPKASRRPGSGSDAQSVRNEERQRVFDLFRRLGYLEARLDPLELFQRVITVSLETIKIVNALPMLDI